MLSPVTDAKQKALKCEMKHHLSLFLLSPQHCAMSEFNCPYPDVSAGKTIVTLKKRKKLGNFRKRDVTADDKINDDDCNIVDKMTELKGDQSCRIKRQKMISTLDLSGLTGGGNEGPLVEKSMKEMIGSQFSIQEHEMSGGTISHDNLLEKYIKDQIGEGESCGYVILVSVLSS